MHITLQLFGAFRPFGDQLELALPELATVADIRTMLEERMPEMAEVIHSSRFATETEILAESTVLQESAMLAIIPPVSGG